MTYLEYAFVGGKHSDTAESSEVVPEPWNSGTMTDQEEHQLLGFDDSPVVIPEPKKISPEVNGSAIQVTKAELILNSLNSEKSLQNGNREAIEPVNTKDANGCTKIEDGPAGDRTNNHHAAAPTRDGEPLYSEVPEDNIYEEVIPVHDRKVNGTPEKVQEAAPKVTEVVSSPLYDDSSLSSELSTELSPPPSNVGDGAGSNGTTLSDPECDAIMTVGSAPESQLHGMDVPFVVIEESTPVDSDQSNDEVSDPPAEQVKTEPVEEALVEPTILPIVKTAPEVEVRQNEPPPETSAPEAACPNGAIEQSSSQPVIYSVTEFTKVEAVQFVESDVGSGSAHSVEERCSAKDATVGSVDACVVERSAEEKVRVETEIGEDAPVDAQSVEVDAGAGDSTLACEVASEPIYATPATVQSIAPPVVLDETPILAHSPAPPVVLEDIPASPSPQQSESRQLKQSAEDSIVAREIRAQKEREETIARERKLAQEAAKLSPVVEKPADKPTVHADASVVTRPSRLPLPQGSSSPQSASVPPPFPAPIEKRFNCPSDSKIADEIRELQEREEELRLLRERLLQNEAAPPTKLSSDEGDRGLSVSSLSPNGISRTVSVESLPNGQSGLSFGSRRKDKITVRPLSDGLDEAPSPTSFSSNGESPIEREIRLTRDREEALRREKGLLGQLQAEGFIKKGDTVLPSSICKTVKTGSVPRGPPPLGSTQKILATSRIQQEIEEQTLREMALRESGHIQTISQERTDSRVTRIGNDETVSPPAVSTATSKRNSFDASLPNVEIFEKTSTNKLSPSSPPAPVVKATNGHATKATNGTTRGVSMQKFLASRGKELVFTTPPQNGGFAEKSAGFEYRELKPPQLQKGVVPGDALRKGLVTAETKIQEEMRVMKEREEELRRQRIRLLGQSQPNLSLLESYIDLDSVDGHQLQRVGSNPNLLESAQPSSPEGSGNAAPRRRSALIAQWEQRIQSTDVVKS